MDGTPTRRSRPSSTPSTAGTRSCPQVSRSRPRSTRSSWSPSSRARSITNQTYELPDGTIEPLEFPTGAPEGPQPFRVERRDGCTELTGPGIERAAPGDRLRGPRRRAQLLRDRRRSPGLRRADWFGGAIVLGVRRAGFPTELPSISVVESDGQWYVSPIGTMGASVVERVPVGARRCEPDRHAPRPVCCSSGMDRQAIDSSLAGRSDDPTGVRAGRGGRRRRSRDGHPRSTGQRDPRLRGCPVQRVRRRQRQRQRSRQRRRVAEDAVPESCRSRRSTPACRPSPVASPDCCTDVGAADSSPDLGARERPPPIRTVRFRAHDVESQPNCRFLYTDSGRRRVWPMSLAFGGRSFND